jgi:hypothetical protein
MISIQSFFLSFRFQFVPLPMLHQLLWFFSLIVVDSIEGAPRSDLVVYYALENRAERAESEAENRRLLWGEGGGGHLQTSYLQLFNVNNQEEIVC